MTDTQTKLYQGQPATTDTLLYTAPATGATILAIHCANTTSAVATITIGVNATGTLAVANEILTLFPIPPYGTYDYTGMIQLDNSATTGTIRALQGTTSAITVIISGNVIT